MDGNGRWAKKRGLPRNFGHSRGAAVFKAITEYCATIGIKTLTVYAFSTENRNRPKEEVEGIMDLFRDYLRDTSNYLHKNVRTRFIGEREDLPEDIIALMESAEDMTKDYAGMVLNIGIDYGGRDELIHAANAAAKTGKITKESLTRHLYAGSDADLIIRTGGEFRLSNFLLWQSAYAELVFLDKLWPDFKENDIDEAVDIFSKRNRRFGKV